MSEPIQYKMIFQLLKLRTLSILVVVLLMPSIAILTTSCQNAAQKQSINACLDVKVEDPEIRRITEVTSQAEIHAKGKFQSGTYFINSKLVSIPPDTTFELILSLPIENPAVISTRGATGSLSTSKQISFNAVPVPTRIELNKGTVSGEVDLARSIAAFFFNLIQVGVASGDMKDMLQEMAIEKLVLELRPDSTLKFGEKSIHIASDSRVALRHAKFDNKLNYTGECQLDLNFARNCKWIGEKVDCEFDGGEVDVVLEAKKVGDRMVLLRPPALKEKPILLENCCLRFGKSKRSSAQSKLCTANLDEFIWQHLKSVDHPLMRLKTSMRFSHTDLKLKTDIHQTEAFFPEEVPGELCVEIKEDGRDTHFATTAAAHAKEGTITIEKKATKLVLDLLDVTIAPVSFDKESGLHFSLGKGVSQLKQLSWQSKENRFVLKCGAGSTLVVPDQMLLEKTDPAGSTHLTLPMVLKLGSASLETPQGKIELARLAGNVKIDVNKEIQLTSNLDIGLKNLKLLNGYAADVKARGLDFSVQEGKSRIALNNCSVRVPDEPLREAIRKRVPSSFQIKLDKTIKEDKTWRYRNAIAKDVSVKDFEIEDMHVKSKGVLAFTANGVVDLNGTVEKTGILLNKNDWQTKPWNLHGKVKGEGTVEYKFKNANEGDLLHYDLAMELSIPEDIKLDWSKVTGGIIRLAERKVIVGRLKSVKVPLTHEGDIDVFQEEGPWKNLQIKKLAIKDASDGGTEITFIVESHALK